MEGQRATLGGSVAQPQAMAAGEPSPVALDFVSRAGRSSSTAP